MPQLDPRPWLFILIFAWYIFLAVIPQKILAHLFPNEPTTQDSKQTKPRPYNWQWH